MSTLTDGIAENDSFTGRSTGFAARKSLGVRVFYCALLIVVGASSGVQVLGYTFTGLSGFCFLAAPAVLLMTLGRGDRLIIAVSVVGMIGYAVSSRVNDTPLFDQRLYQWAAFALYVVGMIALAGRELERIFALATGVALGSCFYFSTIGLPALGNPSVENFWKYAYAPWVTLIGLYVLVLLNVSLRLQALLLVALAATSLVLNYRSHALVCLGAAAVIITTEIARGRIARWAQLAIVAVLALLFGKIVPAIALSGIAGQALKEKTELQDTAGVPSILAGRTESPLSVTAISEKPWFGWGTANSITDETFARAENLAHRIGFDPTIDLPASWHLPNGDTSLHSTLLNAWAEGGILAFLLPFVLLCAAIAIVWNSPRYCRWAAMAVVLAVQAAWDLCFSPTTYNLLPIFAVMAVAFGARHLVGNTSTDSTPSTGVAR